MRVTENIGGVGHAPGFLLRRSVRFLMGTSALTTSLPSSQHSLRFLQTAGKLAAPSFGEIVGNVWKEKKCPCRGRGAVPKK